MGRSLHKTMTSTEIVAHTTTTTDGGFWETKKGKKVAKISTQFKKAGTRLAGWTTSALQFGGNVSWAVGTSLMILVVPVVLDIMRDQELSDFAVKQEAYEIFQRQQSATIVGGAVPAGKNIPGMPAPPRMQASQ